MSRRYLLVLGILGAIAFPTLAAADDLPPVSERARRVHAEALLFDGHNDLPWRFRQDGDVKFERLDIAAAVSRAVKRISRGCAKGD